MSSGRLHIETEHCEYLIDTNKRQYQRALKKTGKQFVVDGDWKPFDDWYFQGKNGCLELVVHAPGVTVFSGKVIKTEEVS